MTANTAQGANNGVLHRSPDYLRRARPALRGQRRTAPEPLMDSAATKLRLALLLVILGYCLIFIILNWK